MTTGCDTKVQHLVLVKYNDNSERYWVSHGDGHGDHVMLSETTNLTQAAMFFAELAKELGLEVECQSSC